ncbi:MAG: hypothetical protein IPJ68_00110 [Candidatus Moraniibacteriota bacterium]|nr:MAG: hypothetical protein IPJ68_00110 [Candidatus Moranbacteria bacterium]
MVTESGWDHDANNHTYWDDFEFPTRDGTGSMSAGTIQGSDTTPPARRQGWWYNNAKR